MKIFKIGSQIGQTVKNVTRLRTILTVMAKQGLDEIVDRFQLARLIPGFILPKKEIEKEKLTLPQRFRLTFEELGPTFIKLGQVLSTRPDLIPQEFADEFKHLQDNVHAVDFSIVKKNIEKELKQPIDQVFKSIHETPLAAASIAQVHEAELLDGTQVVIKVQRPGLEKLIDTDINILFVLARFIEKYFEESVTFNPVGVVEEFFKTLQKEVDFIIEAGNMTRIRKNFEGDENIVIPQVYRKYSTKRILILDKIEGIRLSDEAGLQKKNVDIQKVTHIGVQAFYKMVLVQGLFHADLHAGNIFILKGNKVGLVDFGIVGRLNQRSRDALGDMFLAIVTEDYDALVDEYCEIGVPTGKVNVEHFSRQVRELIEPYYGLPLKEVNVGKLLLDLSVIASEHNLRMSQDLMLVFKAIFTVEGMGRSIDPEFDILKEMTDFSKTLFQTRYNPERLSREFSHLVRDTTRLLKGLPRQLRQLFKKITNDELVARVKIENLEEFQQSQLHGKQLLSLSVIIASIVLSSTIILVFHKGPMILGFSIFGIIGLGLSALLCFLYFISYFKN